MGKDSANPEPVKIQRAQAPRPGPRIQGLGFRV